MTDKISEELRQFVIRQSCVEDEEITIETSLEEDLGVTGDDATDFMVAYGKAFNVDVTNFLAADYFEDEGPVLLRIFMRKLFGNENQKKKLITVGHLEKGILHGRLDEEVING